MLRMWVGWPLISLLMLACTLAAGEPSGGQSGGRNAAAPERDKAALDLPWPEPDAAEVEKLKAELKGQLTNDFSILSIGPWVVATDMSEATARRFTHATIAKYGAAIQRQLFAKPRSAPVKVYLFKDDTSYRVWNKKLFNETPSTPYGYYSRTKCALVMNIGTGGGTLLHEMVHAMAEPDFPKIPAWLNEGLGSLFEASNTDAKGKVIGITNWRLTGLQRDLKSGTATKLSELLAMDDGTFYGERSGNNYAAARYLMQYLQQQGKLEAFYARVRDARDADGAAALRAVFDGKLTLDEIETRCYEWVKTLQIEY